MKQKYLLLAVVLFFAGLQLAACSQAPATTEEVKPATIERLQGAEPTKLTLTEDAAKRLDIQTAQVSETTVSGAQRKAIPYGAIVYDTEGKTWTYTSPEPFVYFRHPVTVESISGDQAILSDGPDTGVAVVTTGSEELFGSETEFAEE